MATPTAPRVTCELVHPTLSVADVRAAAEFYTRRLGFTLGFEWGDPPSTVGVNLGSTSIHLQTGTPDPQGCSVYFVVGDADALHAFQRAQGVTIAGAIADRPWGLREYRVRDLDGYELVFGHRLPGGAAPIEIERVDVSLRLERRLSALLDDLAAHKGMTLSSCVEEIVLHSFERQGDAVASPHDARTHDRILELKRKHGIDYDAHASYRFTERKA